MKIRCGIGNSASPSPASTRDRRIDQAKIIGGIAFRVFFPGSSKNTLRSYEYTCPTYCCLSKYGAKATFIAIFEGVLRRNGFSLAFSFAQNVVSKGLYYFAWQVDGAQALLMAAMLHAIYNTGCDFLDTRRLGFYPEPVKENTHGGV